jgi:hypothetical protein
LDRLTFWDWGELSANPNAFHILKNKKYKNKIRYEMLSINPNPEVIEFLINETDSKWPGFNENPNAMHLFEKSIQNVNFDYLSKNPNAIPILNKYPEKINWFYASYNKNILHIDSFEKNINKINYSNLSSNLNINNIISELIKYY